MAAKKDSLREGVFKNWSWLATFTGACLSGPPWIIFGLWYFGYGVTAARLLDDWSHEVGVIFLIVVLLGRMIAVARWPRKTPIDYSTITIPGVVAANFITIIIGAMLLICTLALVAPGAIEKSLEVWANH